MTSRKGPVDTPATLSGWLSSPAGVLVSASFLASRVFLLFFHRHVGTDVKIYFTWYLKAAAGQLGYRDFPIEYPPLAWWLMQWPATVDKLSYIFRFRLMMGAFDLAAFALLLWIVARLRPSALSLVGGLYVASSVILEYLLFDRLDIGVLCFVLAGIAAWLHASDTARPGGWKILAYAALAAGASFKLFPGFALPLFVRADVLSTTPRWRALGRAAVGIAIGLLPVAIAWLGAGPAVFGFLAYHARRGIECESTWASLMWVLGPLSGPLSIDVRFTSWEVVGATEAVVKTLASAAAVAFIAGALGWALVLRERLDHVRACLLGALMVGGFVAVSKVFSPQYLLWSIPLLTLAAIELLDSRRRLYVFAGLSMLVAVLTTAVYPFGARAIAQLAPWVMNTLLVRNVIYLGMVVWLLVTFHRSSRRAVVGAGDPALGEVDGSQHRDGSG